MGPRVRGDDERIERSVTRDMIKVRLGVVPAKAGTHTPCPIVGAMWQRPFATKNTGGYGSPRARGRREKREKRHERHDQSPSRSRPYESRDPYAVSYR